MNAIKKIQTAVATTRRVNPQVYDLLDAMIQSKPDTAIDLYNNLTSTTGTDPVGSYSDMIADIDNMATPHVRQLITN